MNEIYEANKTGKNVLSTGEGFFYRGRLYPCDLVAERVELLQDSSDATPKYEGDLAVKVCKGLYCQEKDGVRHYKRKIKATENVWLVYNLE